MYAVQKVLQSEIAAIEVWYCQFWKILPSILFYLLS